MQPRAKYSWQNPWITQCMSQDLVHHGGSSMSRMNHKVQNAYRIYPTKSWLERLLRGKLRFAGRIACKANHWPVLCSRWQPGYFYERNFQVQRRRRPGRPPKRWDDQLQVFFWTCFSFIMDDCCPSLGFIGHIVPWTGFCAVLFGTMMIELWILFPCPLRTVAVLLTRTGLSEWRVFETSWPCGITASQLSP